MTPPMRSMTSFTSFDESPIDPLEKSYTTEADRMMLVTVVNSVFKDNYEDLLGQEDVNTSMHGTHTIPVATRHI